MSKATLCNYQLSRLVSILCLLYITMSSTLVVVVSARIRKLELNISLMEMNSDCYNQTYPVLLVNGQHPSPPIRATKGDELHVTVRNSEDSEYSTSIHFHGILQIGTNEADGMPGVTQVSIPPGEVYHQNFRVIGQTGTYFYHSHTDYQDTSAHGPMIIYETDQDWPTITEDEGVEVEAIPAQSSSAIRNNNNRKLREGPYEYDDERFLFFTEWWHQNNHERFEADMSPEFNGFRLPDSCLINGWGVYDPSNNLDNPNCGGYSAIDVEPGKTYRVRVIGATTIAAMGFSVARHSFTVIEVDGELVQPFQTDFLEVSPGQRFSVLLKADQTPNESYNIVTNPYFVFGGDCNAKAILRYNSAPSPQPENQQDKGLVGDLLDTVINGVEDLLGVGNNNGDKVQNPGHIPKDNVIKPEVFKPHARRATIPDTPVIPPPTAPQLQGGLFPALRPVKPTGHDFIAPPDRTIVLTPVERELEDGTTRWFINDHPPHDWDPYLLGLLEAMDRPTLNETAIQLNKEGLTDGFDEGHKTYPLRVGEVVDFVIHSTIQLDRDGVGQCVGHPWHTHGTVHYPIADGFYEYNHILDHYRRTYPTPIAKDTTNTYPAPQKNWPPVSGIPCGWTKIRIFVSNPGVWGFHCHITGHMLQGMMTVLEVSTELIPILQ